MKTQEKRKGVQPLSTALKTLALLDIVAQQKEPVRLADLTRLCVEGKATIYQRLLTLTEAGWVEQSEPGIYRLSLRSVFVGEAALEQSSLGDRATAVLQRLVLDSGETASLAVLDGVHARLVKRVEAEVVVRATVRVGTALSLTESSSGRVLTAFGTPEDRRLLKLKGAKLAPNDVLESVRTQGYAVSTGKDVPGVRSVAMPIFLGDKACIAALSVVTPDLRFDAGRLLAPLKVAAAKLNAQMATG